MAEKVSVMVLKVDLQCPCCYKKVKKILCKIPQEKLSYVYLVVLKIFWTREIRDQVYNEKANTVTITVVCCDPEKIRDKLCCKGAKVIKSIDIKDPPKPEKPKEPVKVKEPEKPKEPVKVKEPEKPKEPVKPKEPEKPKVVVIEKPPEPTKPKVVIVEPEKPKEKPPPPPVEKPKEAPKPDPPPLIPVKPCSPVRTCCGQCYGGYGGGPCHYGYGVPPPPQPCYNGYVGCGCRCGCDRPCHVSRCDYYFSEENPQACSIM